MAKMRIVIADDHAVVRRGLRSILQSQAGWEICSEARTGREAVAEVRRYKPDVAVLDITMPEMNGLDATRQIVKEVPRTEVLILTMHSSEELTREALRAGARAIVLKSDADETLVSAVNALRQHKPFLTTGATEFVLDKYLKGLRGKRGMTSTELTGRERQVVQLVSEGRSNKEIAAKLGITAKTVETHRGNVMRKLNLHSVSELVRYAIRNRIVQAD